MQIHWLDGEFVDFATSRNVLVRSLASLWFAVFAHALRTAAMGRRQVRVDIATRFWRNHRARVARRLARVGARADRRRRVRLPPAAGVGRQHFFQHSSGAKRRHVALRFSRARVPHRRAAGECCCCVCRTHATN